ncbi:MAG: DMT family transporter [Oscillochloridaceae bacterium umkhey_bin13]
MGVIYGLLAALGWGAGDFMLSRISRSLGARQALFFVQLVGITAIGLVLLVRRDLPPSNPGLWALAVGVNLFNVAGTVLLYRALTIGTLAIVSPIAASFAVVTAVLAVLGGERLAPLAWAGVALVVTGVIVVSRPPSIGGTAASLEGAPAAVGAAICYGIFFYLLSPVTTGLGIAWPIMVGRVLAVIVAIGLLAAAREAPRIPPRRTWGRLILATSFDTAAFLAYNLGIATAYVSVVTALASIFSAVTVLLAWVILRERLAASQWAGVAALLCGVLLVSM